MTHKRLAGWCWPLLCVCIAGCIGRPPMHQGGVPFGQPQYVTIPDGAPGPIASPQPIVNPAPISSPQPGGPSSPIATPPSNPIDGGGLTLTPAARRASWPVPTYPRYPTYQTWRTPATFIPLGTTYNGFGRPISMNQSNAGSIRPLKSALQQGSQADLIHRRRAGQSLNQAQLVGGFRATPNEDLKYRGGRTIRDLTYINIYIGGKSSWNESERKCIDWALSGAMTDPHLNHVIMQYFNDQPVSASYRGSFLLDGFNPPRVTQGNIREIVKILHGQGKFSHLPLESTAICFYLPKGTILEDPDSGGQRATVTNGVIPHEEESSSLMGLGGYHGSVHIGSQTLYYAAGVYSERLANGQTNGIPVFKVAWKDICATMYHELQEIRTDPDVDDAIVSGQERYVGWVSDSGEEIADYPVEADGEDGKLDQVFVEVSLANGSGKVPVQLCYSNAVHGPEGPIETPHRGSPLPVPPASPPPWDSQPSPAPSPQPTNPPTGGGGKLDPTLDWLTTEWDHLPASVKRQILELIQDSHSHAEEESFGQ